ncbi:Mfa1 family fimbria major subunit [Bacteroides reticulotermitis]|uniref:Mfa1 family fimbria major subunit n=1 Tax=Bacteroides reticulotermitis TaxID=1133319 RepID=UPI003A88CF06
MKANFKYVMMMAAALTMGLSSCSNESDVVDDTSKEGVKTYASIKFSSPSTYATSHTGTTEESTINTVDVFIYNSGGFLKNHHQFSTFAETTPGSGVWETTQLMETTSGAKQIYVGINLPSDIITSLSTTNKTLAALTSVAQAITVADIATNNNFAMGSDVTPATFTPWDGVTGSMPDANAITVNVKRFASKITVEEKASLALANVDGGTLSDLQFALGQVNLSTYAAQKKVGTTIEDPNYAAPSTAGDGLADAPVAADYSTVNAAGTAINTLVAKYAPENTNDNVLAGNLTYVSVSAKFAPKKVLTGTTGAWVETTHGTVGGFWCIKTTTGNLYFKSVTEATDYAAEYSIPAANVVEYAGGTCYYTVYVNKAKNYDIFRNDFYQVIIDEIMGLGDKEEGPTVPTNPVDLTTKIKVSVEVTPWNLESENVSLIPQ